MGKLVESTFVTLDGVISDPQNWGPPYWDDEHGGYTHDLLFGADALVLGRETYEGFAEAWPPRGGEFADRMNEMPKHVASRTLTKTTWNASLIEGDAAEGVAKLKEESHGDLLKFGTGELSQTLLENNLIDELHLWVFPVIAGSGHRILEGSHLTHLDLKEARAFKSGIVVHVLAPKSA